MRRGGIGQIGGNIGSAAGAGADITFRRQTLIGQHDGLAGNAELTGESTGGGQACARGEAASQDSLPEAFKYRMLASLVWGKHGRYTDPVGPILP